MFKFEFVYKLTENQVIDLLDMYNGESWSKNREIDDVKKNA